MHKFLSNKKNTDKIIQAVYFQDNLLQSMVEILRKIFIIDHVG